MRGSRSLLDADHGTYPFVTLQMTIGGCLSGTGLNAQNIGTVVGISRAIVRELVRVLPTELQDETENDWQLLVMSSALRLPTAKMWMARYRCPRACRLNGVTSLS